MGGISRGLSPVMGMLSRLGRGQFGRRCSSGFCRRRRRGRVWSRDVYSGVGDGLRWVKWGRGRNGKDEKNSEGGTECVYRGG